MHGSYPLQYLFARKKSSTSLRRKNSRSTLQTRYLRIVVICFAIAYADARNHICFLTRHVELPTSANPIPSIQFDRCTSSALAPSIENKLTWLCCPHAYSSPAATASKRRGRQHGSPDLVMRLCGQPVAIASEKGRHHTYRAGTASDSILGSSSTMVRQFMLIFSKGAGERLEKEAMKTESLLQSLGSTTDFITTSRSLAVETGGAPNCKTAYSTLEQQIMPWQYTLPLPMRWEQW